MLPSVMKKVSYIRKFNASVIIIVKEIRECNTSVSTNAFDREM